MSKSTLCVIASITALILALLAAALSWQARQSAEALRIEFLEYRLGADQPWLPQTIEYRIEGEEAVVTLRTPMWPGESHADWLARQEVAIQAWRISNGGDPHQVDR